jgi:hypothetical protein
MVFLVITAMGTQAQKNLVQVRSDLVKPKIHRPFTESATSISWQKFKNLVDSSI